jgi:hypothetical protein
MLSAFIRHHIEVYKGINFYLFYQGCKNANKYNMPISPRKIILRLQDLMFTV